MNPMERDRKAMQNVICIIMVVVSVLCGGVLMCLCSCSLFEKKDETPRVQIVTAAGYKASVPSDQAYSPQVIGEWIDYRINEWVQYRITPVGGSFIEDGLLKVAHGLVYIVNLDSSGIHSVSQPTYISASLMAGFDGTRGLAVIPHELDHRLEIGHTHPLQHW